MYLVFYLLSYVLCFDLCIVYGVVICVDGYGVVCVVECCFFLDSC